MPTTDTPISSVSFLSAEDASCAAPFLARPELGLGCHASESLDLLVCSLCKGVSDLDLRNSGSQKSMEPELYWQLHAETLAAKVDYEYLKLWYKRAAEFYNAYLWDRCTSQQCIQILVHGIGQRNVVISGARGEPVAMSLFKTSKVPDLVCFHPYATLPTGRQGSGYNAHLHIMKLGLTTR